MIDRTADRDYIICKFRKLNRKEMKQKHMSGRTEFDYSRLRGRIKEKCDTQDAFAERLGIGRVSLSQRLNNQLDFSQDEMFKTCDILDIDRAEIPAYFFIAKV